MSKFATFLSDDAGAITVDWVSITAGILLLGVMVIYAIFNSGGVDNLVSNSNATLGGSGPTVTVGGLPTYADAGTDDGGTDGGTDTCDNPWGCF